MTDLPYAKVFFSLISKVYHRSSSEFYTVHLILNDKISL